MDSSFALIGAHQHGIAVGFMNGENSRQLHTIHVGAVGWELQGTSLTTCAGKADQELPSSVCLINDADGLTRTVYKCCLRRDNLQRRRRQNFPPWQELDKID